jgi:hypothetical protein
MFHVKPRHGGGLSIIPAPWTNTMSSSLVAGSARVTSCARSMRSTALWGSRPYPEPRAEDLRLAPRNLGRITGAVDVEDLLDVIFCDFSIGKWTTRSGAADAYQESSIHFERSDVVRLRSMWK